MTQVTVKTIGTRLSQWGEGPIYWRDHLFYVDIEGHALIRLDPESGEETVWNVGERIGTVVPTQDNDIVLYAGDTGFVRLNLKNGEKTNRANPEADLQGKNRFNDGKCDPSGRFWAGSISTVKKTGTANLYMLSETGDVHLKLPDLTNSNGICWSLDATTLYHIDTPRKQVRAFDYDNTTASIANGRTAIDTQALGFDTSPDGMTIDTEGKLWVAFCHGGCVVRFDPDSGQKLMQVDLPCVETTACAFGGPKLDRLFVTSGIKKDLKEPDAGKVFVIDGLAIRGTPAFPYASKY